MNTNIDFFLSTLLLIISLYLILRNVKKFSKWESAQYFVLIPYLAGCVVSILKLIYMFDLFSFLHIMKAQSAVALVIWSSFAATMSLLVIQNMTKQKVKVLWRLPILGLFAGMYFEWKYIGFISLGYFALITFISVKRRQVLDLITPVLFLLLPVIMAPFYYSIKTMWLFEVLVIYFFLITQKFSQYANIKSLLNSKDSF